MFASLGRSLVEELLLFVLKKQMCHLLDCHVLTDVYLLT